MVKIETERLTLSELESKDAPFVFELYNDPDFIKYIGDRGIGSISDGEKFIETLKEEIDPLDTNFLILSPEKN